MSNIANNTTIDGKKIISESDSNNHRHDTSQIIGLSDSAIGDSFIYAEFIDGMSYVELQSQFISDSNNIMTGTLNISTNSNNENNIINVFELDALKSSNNIREYEITELPPVEEINTTQRSIMATGSNSSIDLSWTPSLGSGSNSSISVVGPNSIGSDQTIQLEITNYSSFDTYSVSTDKGTASLNVTTGIIEYQSPSTAPSSDTAILSIENITRSVTKDISISITQDPEIAISYLNDGVYESVTTSITVDTSDDITLRLDTYDPNYTYNVSTSSTEITSSIVDDIITLSLPQTNTTQTTETITVSRSGDTFQFILIIEPYAVVSDEWYISTIEGSSSEFLFKAIKNTNDDIVTVGYQQSDSVGSSDMFLIKYDSNYDVISQKSLGEINSDNIASICLSDDGGYVVVGNRTPVGTTSGREAFIIKLDSNLNPIFQKMLGGSEADLYRDVLKVSSGGYVAVGDQYSDPSNGSNASPLIVKYDSNLNIVAKTSIEYNGPMSVTSIVESYSGGFVLVGDSVCPITVLDSNLNILSQKRITSTPTFIYKIIQSNDGGYITVGHRYNSTNSENDAFITKYDSNMNEISSYILTSTNGNYFEGVCSTGSGYMAVGRHFSEDTTSSSDFLIAKYDENLNLLDSKILEGITTESLEDIIPLGNGKYFASGYYSSYDAINIVIPDDLSNITEIFVSGHSSNFEWRNPVISSISISHIFTTTSYSTYNPSLFESFAELSVRDINLPVVKTSGS